MKTEQLIELINYINFMLEQEQNALKDDDPSSNCASRHRGEISAYGRILKKIYSLMTKEKL
jgi:hypothetical protein